MKHLDDTEPENAQEAAILLIEPYVLRGDDADDLRHTMTGAWCGEWASQIGGFFHAGPLAHKKHFGTDKILVQRVNGEDCAEVFSFSEIYQLIKARDEQPSLF